jgi:hypothetical protein
MLNTNASLVIVAFVVGLAAEPGGVVRMWAAADAQAGPVVRQAACDPGKVAGVWLGARYSMEVLGDGTYRASGTPNMATIDVTGTLKIDRCNATFVDKSGRFACPATSVGRYTFSVSDTTIAFTPVNDPCDGRRIPLTSGPLTRKNPSR